MTYSESSILRYAGLSWSVRSINSAVATSAGFMRRLCHNFVVHRVALALVLVAALAGRARAEEIEEIVVEGNTKTTSDTVELIAGVDTGDDWKPEMVDTVKARLVSCGLFNDVDVFWEPTPRTPGSVK